MDPLIEKRGAGFHVVSEGNGNISREEILVADAAGKLATGTILGKLTADGSYVQVDLTGEDGEQTAAAVLWGAVDATDDAVRAAAHVRYCEVLGSELVYPTGATDGNKATINGHLRALGIIVR